MICDLRTGDRDGRDERDERSGIMRLLPRALHRRRIAWRALMLACVAAASGTDAQTAPMAGIAYLIRFSGWSGVPGDSGAVNTRWSGRVELARGRGRMDVASGREPGAFEPGDFVLFDSSKFAVVYPRRRTYAAIPADLWANVQQLPQLAGATQAVRDGRITLDSLGPAVTSDSLPATHYRITLDLQIGLGVADYPFLPEQPVHSKTVTDYWFGAGTPVTVLPILHDVLNEPDPGVPLPAALRARLDSVWRSLPLDRALVMTAHRGLTEVGHNAGHTTVDTIAISQSRSATVDASRLVVPAGFALGKLEAFAAIPFEMKDSTVGMWLLPPTDVVRRPR